MPAANQELDGLTLALTPALFPQGEGEIVFAFSQDTSSWI
jgi:hypothetical protein